MTTERTVNYTSEQETQLQQLYQGGTTVAELAEIFNKSERSIVAKLSRMGVYNPKTVRGPSTRVTKASLVETLEHALTLSQGTLETLNKADKPALEALAASVARLAGPQPTCPADLV